MSDPTSGSGIPYRFDPTTTAAAVEAEYGGLSDGEETGVVVSVAGRLMLRRDQGKLAFGDLQDATGPVSYTHLTLPTILLV